MSDLENELLGLAEDDPGRRSKKRHGSHERRAKSSKSKAFIDSDDDGEGEADMDLESEEDEEVSVPAASSSRNNLVRPRNIPNKNPYPLEGKYLNEEDRDALDRLPEIERENILATRLEEMQKFKDSQNLDALFKSSGHVKANDNGDDDDDDNYDDDDGPTKKKRKHTSVTKEATRAMNDLKNKRKAKDERVQRRAARRERRPRSASPASDPSTEDGEISQSLTQSHSYRRSPERSPEYKLPSPKKADTKSTDLDAVPANKQELNSARLSRYELVDIMGKDGFEEVAAGAYVKLISSERDETGRPKYRIHKIIEIQNKAFHRAYEIEYKGRNIMDDRGMLCQYGKARRLFRLADASNSDFDDREFTRFTLTNQADGERPPRRSDLKSKHDAIKELRDRPMTDDEINRQIISRRTNNPSAQRSALFKISQLIQSRDLALRRSDIVSAEALNDQIRLAGGDPKTGHLVESIDIDNPSTLARTGSTFTSNSASAVTSTGAGNAGDDYDMRIHKINENNRKKTKEQMMKAHAAALQRKKAEEAIVRAKAAASASPAPEGSTTKAAALPASGLRKGETPQQYVARTIELDLGDF